MIARFSRQSLSGLTPDEAAAQWLVRMDAAPLDDVEKAEFKAWKAESAANAAAFARAEAAWDLFENTGGDPTLDALRASALEVGREPRRGLWLGVGTGIAASLLAIVAVNAGRLPFLGDDTMQVAAADSAGDAESERNEFATAKGERRTISLADGSRLTLNTDSIVRVHVGAERRLVHLLRGQALFEVAEDPHRPFVVQAAERQVTALGTIFEVRLDDDRMKVTLVEGKVVVDEAPARTSEKDPVMIPAVLAPGQELVAIAGSRPRIVPVDIDEQLSWLDGFVEFRDVPLAEAVAEMNRYTQKPLVIRDDATGKLRVSGLFRTGDPGRFAAIVSELLPIRQRPLPNGAVELSATD